MSKEKHFQFHVPVELTKGKTEDEWRIKGIASTPDQDLQGEEVDQDGLDISILQAGRGLFNFDHQKGPENVLGQIEDAKFVNANGKKALEVEGYLFKHQDRAKAFHNIMRSVKKSNGPRVHLSIEGKVLQRDMSNTKRIKKARIEKVALTLDPVNPYTYADLCKSLEAGEVGGPIHEVDVPEINNETITMQKSDFETLIQAVAKTVIMDLRNQEVETSEKALAAGAGYQNAPTTRTGGEAMTKEDLEQDEKSVTYEKKKKNRKVMLKSIITGLRKAYPDHDPLELAGWVVEAFVKD